MHVVLPTAHIADRDECLRVCNMRLQLKNE